MIRNVSEKLSMKPRLMFICLVCILVAFGSKTFANERNLVASMVKDYRAIDDASQKERLRLYRNVVGNYGKILSEYESTEVGLEILIKGSYMGINFSNITFEYLQELNGYYGTVCADSPSYACLGFTALNEGFNSCRKADVNEAVRGAFLIRKSVEIFSSSPSKEYSEVAMSALKDCAARHENEVVREAVNYQLVAETISRGELSKDFEPAIASIQKMGKDSIYRLLAVIDLQRAQGKLSSSQDKLIATITDKFQSQPERFRFASVHLWSQLFQSKPIVQVSATDLLSSSSYGCERAPSQEDTIAQDFLMGYYLEGVALSKVKKSLQFRSDATSVNQLGGSILKMTCGHDAHIWESKLYHVVKGHPERVEMLDLVASEFSRDQLIAFEVDSFVENSQVLGQFIADRKLEKHPLVSLWYSRKNLDEGDVCSAVKRIFELPRKQLFAAMDYVLKSPKFDASKNYECGDEDLTLLLGSI